MDDREDDPGMDMEGGERHLSEVIAYSTLRRIVTDAIETVQEERRKKARPGVTVDAIRIPWHQYDHFIIECERLVASYGTKVAAREMVRTVKEYLAARKKARRCEMERKADSFIKGKRGNTDEEPR